MLSSPLGSQEVDLRTRVRVQQFIWEVSPVQEHSGEHRQQGTESRGTYWGGDFVPTAHVSANCGRGCGGHTSGLPTNQLSWNLTQSPLIGGAFAALWAMLVMSLLWSLERPGALGSA